MCISGLASYLNVQEVLYSSDSILLLYFFHGSSCIEHYMSVIKYFLSLILCWSWDNASLKVITQFLQQHFANKVLIKMSPCLHASVWRSFIHNIKCLWSWISLKFSYMKSFKASCKVNYVSIPYPRNEIIPTPDVWLIRCSISDGFQSLQP